MPQDIWYGSPESPEKALLVGFISKESPVTNERIAALLNTEAEGLIEDGLARAAGRISADVCADRCSIDDPRVGQLAKLFLGIMREEISQPKP